MKNQVLSLLCGVSFLISSPVFGMDGEEMKREDQEERRIVVRQPFKGVDPEFSLLAPLDHQKDIQARLLNECLESWSPRDCCQVLRVSKSCYNWFLPYQVSFYLSVELTTHSEPMFTVDYTQLDEPLNLKNQTFTLSYLSKNEGNLRQLCSFPVHPSVEPGCLSHSLSGKNPHPVSYFTFHGVPDKMFLQGLPMGWRENYILKRELKDHLFPVTCDSSNIDLSCLRGQELQLKLNGGRVVPSVPTPGVPDKFVFKPYLSNPCYVEPEESKRAKAVDTAKFYYDQNMSLEIIQKAVKTFLPNISMSETRKILGLPDETREEAFARLRPEVIRLIDAAVSIEEIARQLDLPEETIAAIRNSQQDDQG